MRLHPRFETRELRPRVLNIPETPESERPGVVSIRLADVLEPLADAIRSNRTFLSDFAEDEIQISADLYECLNTYAEINKAA